MAWSQRHLELRELLAQLFDREDDARRVVLDAGIEPCHVAWGRRPIDSWQSIVEEAAKRPSGIVKIIDAARRDYPQRTDLVEFRALFERERSDVHFQMKGLRPADGTPQVLKLGRAPAAAGRAFEVQIICYGDPSEALMTGVLLVIVRGRGAGPNESADAEFAARIFHEAGIAGTAVVFVHHAQVHKSRVALGSAVEQLRSILLNNEAIKARRHIFFACFGGSSRIIPKLFRDDVRVVTLKAATVRANLAGSSARKSKQLASPPVIVGRTRCVVFYRTRLQGDPSGGDGLLIRQLLQIHRANNIPIPHLAELDFHETNREVDADQFSQSSVLFENLSVMPLVERLRAYRATTDFSLAFYTYIRTLEIASKGPLIEFDPNEDLRYDRSQRGAVTYAQSGSQQQVFDALLEKAAHQPHDQSQTVIVTGDAGVGKTLLLTRLAQSLSSAMLSESNSDRPLPIFFPLQQIERHDLSRFAPHDLSEAAASWTFLRRYWCSWVTQLFRIMGGPHESEVQEAWLDQRIHSQPVILIFDSIDEFLMNHTGSIGFESFRRLLDEIRSTYRDARHLLIVLGIRSSQPGINLLLRTSSDAYEVLRPSINAAEKWFPGARERLKRIKNPRQRSLLLTPLILTRLGPHIGELDDRRLTTRSSVMGLAIEAIIEQGRLAGQQGGLSKPTHAGQWIEALGIVAWLIFSRFRGYVSGTSIQDEARALRIRWAAFLLETDQQGLADDLIEGLELLLDPQLLSTLLNRTVFVSLGQNIYRFQHKEWEHFLVSRYQAQCIRLGFVSDLGTRAFLSSNFMTAGELLARDPRIQEIGEDFVHRVFAEAGQPSKEFLIANSAAFLGNTSARVSGDAVRLFLNRVDEHGDMVRHVTFQTLCYRALRHHNEDAFSRVVRREIYRAIPKYHDCSMAEGINPVTKRLAWAFHCALEHRYAETPRLTAPWPGAVLEEAEQDRALELVAVRQGMKFHLTSLNRSVQIALGLIQFDILEDPNKTIPACHFLYPMVIAAKAGVLVTEAYELLVEVFTERSDITDMFLNYNEVPQLRDIFIYCKQVFLGK